jgi:hypothetical protein
MVAQAKATSASPLWAALDFLNLPQLGWNFAVKNSSSSPTKVSINAILR